MEERRILNSLVVGSNPTIRIMSKQVFIEKLALGETVKFREKGNSMTPIIESGSLLTFIPITIEYLKVGDVCFCKVKGRLMTHLVTAKNEKKGVQISNNHGFVNGWTKSVFGKCIKVEP